MHISRRFALLVSMAFLASLLGPILAGCQGDEKAPSKAEMEQVKPARKKKGEV